MFGNKLIKNISLCFQEHFNRQLMESDRQFTYLVPSASAWNKIKDRFATAHKQLFMGSFSYHSQARTSKI